MSTSTKYPEIDYEEIKEMKRIGHGSFGTVYKAKWFNQSIAVKEFRTEAHKDKIENEIRNLYQVASHLNIINCYGVSKHNSEIFLIMEYADCGSLQNFLHDPPKYDYTEAHALNWMLQCARAIEYLHSMDPKPLLHRDLKPANLLLANEYRTLKICDFGTVAVLKTHMTGQKGSVPWMAPEVINGSDYTEKCDVFSFGVTLWEIFARKQPYEGKFEKDVSIMYYVLKGGRPELNGNWPEDVQNLIRLCWDQEPYARPDLKSVVKSLRDICKSFVGENAPLGRFSKETLQPGKSDVQNADNYGEPSSLDCTPYMNRNSGVEDRHKENRSVEPDNANYYLIRKERAGFLLIFDQFEYQHTPDFVIRGCRILISTFSSFGYISQQRSNCTSSEMIPILEDSARKSIDYDSLIVCIFAEIRDGAVIGSDGRSVPLRTFVNCMDSDSLKGKPKMLIVQSYQNYHSEIKYPDMNALDMLVVCAGILEYKSWQNILRPMFLPTFCYYISLVGNRDHMLNILDRVEKEYMKELLDAGLGIEAPPQITNTLQKFFYLPKYV